MKRRLFCLNLALVFLLTLIVPASAAEDLPAEVLSPDSVMSAVPEAEEAPEAEAEEDGEPIPSADPEAGGAGWYYHLLYPGLTEGEESVLVLEEYSLLPEGCSDTYVRQLTENTQETWYLLGWSTLRAGLGEEFSGAAEEPVHLYPLWSADAQDRRLCTFGYGTQGDLYTYHPTVELGPVEADGQVLRPDIPAAGTGWDWDGRLLTLSQGYAGGPIRAMRGLMLQTEDALEIRAAEGPAIAAGGSLCLMTGLTASLTLRGGSGSPAVEALRMLTAYPTRLDAAGDGCPALQGEWIRDCHHAVYTQFANVLRQGADPDSAEAGEAYDGASPWLGLEPQPVAVTLKANGGAFADGAEDLVLEAADLNRLPEFPAPVNGGQRLMGWSRLSSGASKSYLHGGEAYRYAAEDTVFYAVWQEVPEQAVLLDGCGELIGGIGRPLWYLGLEDGRAVLPACGLGWSETPNYPQSSRVEDLLWSGEEYALTTDSTLYAVHLQGNYATLEGNGHLTSGGSPKVKLRLFTDLGWGTPMDLLPYYTSTDMELFPNDSEVMLGFNRNADGSGEYVYALFDEPCTLYAQWQEASEDSVILYASGIYDGFERNARAVIVPAAGFDPGETYGAVRSGWSLTGWTVPGGDGAPISALAEAEQSRDDHGRYRLMAVWEPNVLTLVDRTGEQTLTADEKGTVTVTWGSEEKAPLEALLAGREVFVGWNTEEDGSGEWKRPGTVCVPEPGEIWYARYISAPEGPWALVTGTGSREPLCVILTGEETEEGHFSVELGEGLLYADSKYAYEGGKTAILQTGKEYSRKLDTQYGWIDDVAYFHAQEGEFAEHSDVLILYAYNSPTTLIVYPTAEDFAQLPEGVELAGWTKAPEREDADVYAPGTQGAKSGHYWALWESGEHVTVTLTAVWNGKTETVTRRRPVGEEWTLPGPTPHLGWAFQGWTAPDGTVYAPGDLYPVTEEVTFTGSWAKRSDIVVDGVSYAGDETWDFSDGNTSGWRYEPNGNGGRLDLYGCSLTGIEIYRSSASVCYHGDCLIAAPAGKSAILSGSSLQLTQTYGDNGTLTVLGGEGAAAVRLAGTLSLSSYGITLKGEPAVYNERTDSFYTLSLNSDLDVLAGAGEEDLRLLESFRDYKGDSWLVTRAQYVTVTFDAGEGVLFGRRLWTETVLKKTYMGMNDYVPTAVGADFLGWQNSEGETVGYLSPREDATLTALWDVSPYARYVRLDGTGSYGSLGYEGAAAIYLELPENGTVVLPEPDSREGYHFQGYTYNDSLGRQIGLPAGEVPVQALTSGAVLRPWFSNGNDSTVYFSGNGVPMSFAGDLYVQQRSNGNVAIRSLIAMSNSLGLVPESWNTRPDGSGSSYALDGEVAFDTPGWTVLYAQWKTPPTYTTKTDNEILPDHAGPDWDSFWEYATVADNHYGLSGWRDEAGRLYRCGFACGLPAGTVLTAMVGSTNMHRWIQGDDGRYTQFALPILDGNGAGSESPQKPCGSGRNGDTIVLRPEAFLREGYAQTGWNTRPDGRGTAYSLDAEIPVGRVTEDGWVYEAAALAALPDKLYAQWEKLPELTLEVPKDMLEAEEAQVCLALYDDAGRLLELSVLTPGEAEAVLRALPDGAASYRFFCLDAAQWLPLLTAESGRLN